ncbi:vesicle-associated membrane protein 8 [Ctenodactylus gundi]
MVSPLGTRKGLVPRGAGGSSGRRVGCGRRSGPSRALGPRCLGPLLGHPGLEELGDWLAGGGDGVSGGSGNDRVRNLQSEVEGVKNIMTQNVERILARGENLDHLRNKTEDLEATSEHFKTTSQKVARKFWWKNVKMIALICVIVFIIVLLIILFATGAIPT